MTDAQKIALVDRFIELGQRYAARKPADGETRALYVSLQSDETPDGLLIGVMGFGLLAAEATYDSNGRSLTAKLMERDVRHAMRSP